MKKIFIFFSLVLTMANVYAQHTAPGPFITPSHSGAVPVTLPHRDARRVTSTTSTCSISETFGTGSYYSLPSGWSAGTISGYGTWHWAISASDATYTLGPLASSSASNGWMIFDSDSLGGIGASSGVYYTPAGWLQSPSYDFSAFSSVRLTFQELFRKYEDSCFVWVSTDPSFASYTQYPVLPNNSLADNAETANPETVHVDISGAAAGFSAVYIRFVYYGTYSGGYSWMIDDICLSPLSANDVSIGNSFMWEPDVSAFNSSVFSTPLQFADSIYPTTLVSNLGTTAETALPLSANIWNGTTEVYGSSTTYNALTGYSSLPYGAIDSIAEFSGFLPTSTGSYTCAIGAPLTTDGDVSNNYDTVTFAITDTAWMENQGNLALAYLVYYPSTGESYYEGSRFDVPSSSAGDTLSGFGVVFDAASEPTGSGTVSVQLYSATQASTSWTFVASSVARSLTSADISSFSPVSAYFAADFSTYGTAPFILQPGTSYAAVVQVNGVSTMLLVDATNIPNATTYTGYFGQQDVSSDDGSATFGSTLATGITEGVPMVSLYFGNTCHTPATPVFSGGTPEQCEGSFVTYSVPSESGASSYSWTVSGTGWSGTSTTNSILITAGTGNATVTVTANGCGISAPCTFTITGITVPPAPVISVLDSPCVGSSGALFSATDATIVTSYIWDVAGSGWYGSSSSATIPVTAGTGTGTLEVAAVNSCGTGVAGVFTITPGTPPSAAAGIDAPAEGCSGSIETFTATPVTGATGYMWAVAGTGWSGTSTTNTIAITAGTGPGTIMVTPENSCGTGVPFTLTGLATIAAPSALFTISSHTEPINTADTLSYTGGAPSGSTFTWNFGGGVATPGTGSGMQTAMWGTPGLVTVSLTISDSGCTGTYSDTVLVFSNVGLPQLSKATTDVNIRPNPNTGTFDIVFTTPVNGSVQVAITDVLGRSVYKNKFDAAGNNTFPVITDNLPAGSYTVSVSAAGNTVSRKITITR